MKLIELFVEEAADSVRYLIAMLALAGCGELFLLHMIRSNFQITAGGVSFKTVALFLIALALVMTAALKARQHTVRILHTMTMRLFDQNIRQLSQTSFPSFETVGRATVYNILMVDTQKLVELADDVVLVQELAVVAVSGFVYLLWLSPLAFALTAAVLAGGIALILRVYPRVYALIQEARACEKDVFEAMNHLLFGFKELRVNSGKMADFLDQNLTPTCAAYTRNQIEAQYLNADMDLLSTFLDYVRFVPVLFALPLLASASQPLIPHFVAIMLFIPLMDMKTMVINVLTANVSAARLAQLRETLAQLGREEIQWPAKTERRFQTLRYQDITFTYRDQQGEPTFDIGPLDLTLTAGEVVFLIGGNGSGKTTLMKVMTGLYPPATGRIELDGEIIRMEQHRYLFSTIFTDFHLFDRFYGLSGVQPVQVQRLLELMALTYKAQYRDGRFSTRDLSGGQRKRLALITSLLEDKPIYLFDEWAAGQDPEFREYFYLTLLPQFQREGKTIVAITHDDQFFHVADRILKLDRGRLAPYEAPPAARL